MKKLSLVILNLAFLFSWLHTPAQKNGPIKDSLVNLNLPDFQRALEGRLNCCFCISSEIAAQRKITGELRCLVAKTHRISGRITDTMHHPLPFASVIISGTRIGVMADSVGNYVLEVPVSAFITLTASSVGYHQKSIEIPQPGINDRVDIMLDPMASFTCELIVHCKPFFTCTRTTGCGVYKITKCSINSIRIDTSAIARTPISVSDPRWDIFPNPVRKNGMINIKFSQGKNHVLQLADNNARILLQREISIPSGNAYSLRLPSSLASETYYLLLTDIVSKKSYSKKIIIL